MKRSKDRHQITHNSNFRYRRSTSPYMMEDTSNSDFINPMVPFACPLEVDTSSSSLPVSSAFLRSSAYHHHLANSPSVVAAGRDRSNSSCSLNYRGSPYDLTLLSSPNMINSLRRNSDPNSVPAITAASAAAIATAVAANGVYNGRHVNVLSPPTSLSTIPMDSDYDQPLDFSKKSRTGSSSESESQSTTMITDHGSSSRSNTCSPDANVIKGYHNNNGYVRRNQQQQHALSAYSNYHQHSSSSSPSSSSSSSVHYSHQLNNHHVSHLQPRPSVITCASTLFGPRNTANHTCHNSNSSSASSSSSSSPPCSAVDKCPRIGPPPPPQSTATLIPPSFASRKHNKEVDNANKLEKKLSEGPNKVLIIREDSDSDINEHFRRSLGENYRSCSNVSMTVDDHFAKALGETWLKLKERNGTKGNGPFNKNVPTIPS